MPHLAQIKPTFCENRMLADISLGSAEGLTVVFHFTVATTTPTTPRPTTTPTSNTAALPTTPDGGKQITQNASFRFIPLFPATDGFQSLQEYSV